MTYKLVEIFESLQGEGRNSGRPCVFVRLASCNLACPWCDTDVAKRFEASLDELVAEVDSFRAKSVILTGGEPTIQSGMDELVDVLKAKGFWVAVETNGLESPAWLKKVDYIACSPKFEFAERYVEGRRLERANEVRFVASSELVVDFARRMRAEIVADDYYISPCDRNGEPDLATAKNVLDQLTGFSLSVQLHKLLGFR